MKARLLLLVLLGWQIIGRTEPTLPMPATGANIDESRVETTLYVDPANAEAADDERHGSADSPFATFRYGCQAAAKAKDAGKGVKLILANGSYRESAEILPAAGGPDTEAPLVIEAAERDQAIIDGADTEGWTPSTWKTENGRWIHPWPFARAGGPAVPAKVSVAGRRGELVAVNGTPLRQVNVETELAPGCFWIKTGKSAAGAVVVVQPPEETPLEGSVLQVGARPCGLQVRGRRNVVVRGVVFQHAADPSAPGGANLDMIGLALSGCANVLIEDVLCQWNDGAGFQMLGGADVTFRRLRALHNGALGVLAIQLKNVLAEDCEASFNGYRGAWAGADAAPGYSAAVYESAALGMTWRRLRAVDNFYGGLNLNGGSSLTVEDSVFSDNQDCGVWINWAGTALVRRCVVTGTRLHAGGKPGEAVGGVALTRSADVTLRSNVLWGNAGVQLTLSESLIQGKERSERHTYRHNVFVGSEAGQLVCRMLDGDRAKGPVVPNYQGFDVDENCYWNPTAAEAFGTYALSSYAPVAVGKDTAARKELPPVAFEKWRAWWGAETKEARSIWQEPGFVNAAEGDFRLKEGSPVTGWELPSEEAASSP